MGVWIRGPVLESCAIVTDAACEAVLSRCPIRLGTAPEHSRNRSQRSLIPSESGSSRAIVPRDPGCPTWARFPTATGTARPRDSPADRPEAIGKREVRPEQGGLAQKSGPIGGVSVQ